MSIISAGTSSSTAIKATGNTDGTLVLKTNDTGSGGTTALTLATNQAATFASSVSATDFSGPLNGTVGATTPNTGAFTTVNATTYLRATGSTTGVVDIYSSSANSGARNWTFQSNSQAFGDFILAVGTSQGASPTSIISTWTSTGLAVTGTLSSTGSITQGGATANYAGNFRDATVGGSCYMQITTNASGSANTDGLVWGLDTASPPNGYLSLKENATLYLQANSATVGAFSSTGLAVTGTITGPTSISIGTNPAATGELRIPNTGSIYSRNAANSANLQIAGFTSADVLQLNNGGLTASVANGSTLNLGSLQTGLLVVVSNVDFTGVFVLSNLVTYELSDPDSKYSITAGTANSINLYNSAGSVTLQNNSGGTRSFYITHIK